jgi:hypothetical protein
LSEEEEVRVISRYFHCRAQFILTFADRRPLSAHHCQQQRQHEEEEQEEQEEEEGPLSEMKRTPLSKRVHGDCIFSFGMKKVKLFGSEERKIFF